MTTSLRSKPYVRNGGPKAADTPDPAQQLGARDIALRGSEIREACDAVLASEYFTKAPRTCSLLRFLVEHAISGDGHGPSEYAIGLEVFERREASYNPAEDPIVRVQIGRLRQKLKAYYAALEGAPGLEIVIPTGSHLPIFCRSAGAPAREGAPTSGVVDRVVAIAQFRCITRSEDAEPFAHGVCDELAHQLFKTFGSCVTVRRTRSRGRSADEGRGNGRLDSHFSHLVEGSIRVDAERIRASIRVVEVTAGHVVWSEQFDRDLSFAIAQQEELAASVCHSLKCFFLRT